VPPNLSMKNVCALFSGGNEQVVQKALIRTLVLPTVDIIVWDVIDCSATNGKYATNNQKGH